MIEEPEEMLEEEDVVIEEELSQEEAVAAAEEQRQYSLAFGKINALIAECSDGVSDREAEALALAAGWYALITRAKRGFADARTLRAKAAKPQEQPPAAEAAKAKDHGGPIRLGRGEAFSRPPMQPAEVSQPEPEPEPEQAEAEPEPSAAISALLAELKRGEEEQSATVVELKPKPSVVVPAEPKAAKSVPDWATVDWDEDEEPPRPKLVPPPEVVSVAKLALPGIAGEIQEEFLRTASQPSHTMSLAVGLMVPTVLVSGNVIGPSGRYGVALQQFVAMLAKASSGKQYGIDFTKECVVAAGQEKLIGPNRFKSGAALVRLMKENRVQLCIQDEFGAMLARLGDAKAPAYEVDINVRMREFWAQVPGGMYNSPVGAEKGDDSVTVRDARLSIFGWGNRDEFYKACKGSDITSGFLNRLVVLEDPERLHAETVEYSPLPEKLKDLLLKLGAIRPQKLGWTDRTKEIFEEVKLQVESLTDERKLYLSSRTPEKIVRAASTFAATRFALKVSHTDMEAAQAMMQMSDQVLKNGMDDAEGKRVLDHADLKLEIERRLRSDFPGYASVPEIKRSFRHNTKFKGAIDAVLFDMKEGGIISSLEEVETGGRTKKVHRLIDFEG